MQESTEGALKVVGDQLRHHPEQVLPAELFLSEKNMSYLIRRKHVYIMVSKLSYRTTARFIN